MLDLQPPLRLEGFGADGHHPVAVDGVSLLVDRQAAVRVAVKGDAKIIPAVLHRGAQGLKMRRAAALVDVDAVRLVIQILHLQRETAEQIPRRGRGRAVRAVDEHAQGLQILHGGGQVVEIILRREAAGHDLADLAVRLDGQLTLAQDQLLDARLERVAELEALGREHLDAVVLVRIVRGGDDHARVRVQIDRQICDRRRRDDAKQDRVAAAGRQARDERAFEHVGGNARVLADDDGRLRAGIVRERDGCRLPDAVGELRVQRLVGHAADAVGPK